MRNRIFSFDSAKAIKAMKYGYLNAIHYMAPADTGGAGNLCPHASAGCKSLCLGKYSGQAAFVADLENGINSVRQSRADKARRFMRDRPAYMADLVRAIELAQVRARRLRRRLCVRLNGSTDISWEGIACERNGRRFASVYAAFPAVQFVDYTKNPRRFTHALPANLHLTFSRSETNETTARALLGQGHNVAVVFSGPKPQTWNDYRVIDGDTHDLRHLDPRVVVVGLSPKGAKARRDTSGFIVRQ